MRRGAQEAYVSGSLQALVEASSRDFAEAAEEQQQQEARSAAGVPVQGRDVVPGPKRKRAQDRVVEIASLAGWKVTKLDAVPASGVACVARRGQLKYLVECVWDRGSIGGPALDACVDLFNEVRYSLRVGGLLLVCPLARVDRGEMTSLLIRHRNQRIEVLDADNWVKELERPDGRAGSTTAGEVAVMVFVAFVGVLIIGLGFALRFDYLVIGSGYIVYAFGVIGVTVSTYYKYRRL